jgi:hypothetical protein
MIGAWNVHAAIRHTLDGITVNGMAKAAIRANRETPAAGHARPPRPREPHGQAVRFARQVVPRSL